MKRALRWLPALLLGIIIFFPAAFLIELTVGLLLFSRGMCRKPHFVRRLTAALALELAVGVPVYLLCSLSSFWPVRTVLCYVLLFLFVGLGLPALCFDEPPAQLLLCGVSGYMAQHIASQFWQTLWPNDVVRSFVKNLPSLFLWGLLQAVICAVVYALLYVLFARKTRLTVLPQEMNTSLIRLSVMSLLVVVAVSGVRDAYAAESVLLTLMSRILSVFICFSLLYLRSYILELGAMAQERAELQHLHELQLRQYAERREDVDLINVKCHDLRRRLEVWEQRGGQVDAAELCETRKLVELYDSSVKTGNNTLDTLLTQNSLRCRERGIRLSCMADGRSLGFLSEGDLCALFGNALENAIDAVSKLEPEQRSVSLQVREALGLLVITVENPYQGTVLFEDGLPVTTKGDTGWHGYGMRSMRMVAERYGGELSVSADTLFRLTVSIPLSHDAAQGSGV